MFMHSLEQPLRLPEGFVGFNPCTAMRVYRRNLPHWRQPGVTYFLTFRLRDSVPRDVLERVREERIQWKGRLQDERSKHGGSLPEAVLEEYNAFLIRMYRLVEEVMDAGHGDCVFSDVGLRNVVTEALLYFHGQRCEMHGFVVMPNHVHACVRPLQDWQPEQLLHSWKRFTTHQINERLGRAGPLWQQDTWDRIVRDDEHWFRVMRYIMRNPGHAKLLRGQSTVWVWNELLCQVGSVGEEVVQEGPW